MIIHIGDIFSYFENPVGIILTTGEKYFLKETNR